MQINPKLEENEIKFFCRWRSSTWSSLGRIQIVMFIWCSTFRRGIFITILDGMFLRDQRSGQMLSFGRPLKWLLFIKNILMKKFISWGFILFQNRKAVVALSILMFVVLSAIFHLIQIKLRFRKCTLSGVIKMIEIIARAFLATSNPTMINSLRMRFLIGSWFWSCIFINACIQTNFIAFLTKPELSSEISTQEELLNSGIPINYGPSLVILLSIVGKKNNSSVLCINSYEQFVPRLYLGKEFQKISSNKTTSLGLLKVALKEVSFEFI